MPERLLNPDVQITPSAEYRRRLVKVLSAPMASIAMDFIAEGIWTKTDSGAGIHDHYDTMTITASGPDQDIEALIAVARIVVFKGWRTPCPEGATDLTQGLIGILSRLGWPTGEIMVSHANRIARNFLISHTPIWSLSDENLFNDACNFIHAALPYPDSAADATLAEMLRKVAIEDFGSA